VEIRTTFASASVAALRDPAGSFPRIATIADVSITTQEDQPRAERIRRAVERVETGAFDPLGSQTVDVSLNADVFWRNVPQRAWEYTLGGYQVLKK
jgi:hypothetical protein